METYTTINKTITITPIASLEFQRSLAININNINEIFIHQQIKPEQLNQ
ncbi:hypothetical protein L580_0334 [Serratia fonticola AU-P3(3)]|nr:hypothetical protein L580_0334 [Serratia fonticola AU-P3(3)]